MVRKIFRAKREEITSNWRNLHNEDLYFYLLLTKYSDYSVYQVKRDEMARACGTYGEKRTAYSVSVQRNLDERECIEV